MKSFPLALVICVLALLPGCQLGARSEVEKETQRVDLSEQRVFLGNVTLVNRSSRFVLIKTPINQRFDVGMPLQSFRDGQLSGDLLFSPEQTFGFMTADIASGRPAIGDAVYLHHSEGFETKPSPRLQQEIDKFERKKNMGFFERKKFEREQKAAARQRSREP